MLRYEHEIFLIAFGAYIYIVIISIASFRYQLAWLLNFLSVYNEVNSTQKLNILNDILSVLDLAIKTTASAVIFTIDFILELPREKT